MDMITSVTELLTGLVKTVTMFKVTFIDDCCVFM